jgi:ketosteroid isomerase-like protein
MTIDYRNGGKMKILVIALMVAVASALVQAQTRTETKMLMTSQATKADDTKAVLQVIQKLFAAMRAKDSKAISSLFVKDGQLVAAELPQTGNGPSTTQLVSVDVFAKMIADSKGGDEFIEEMKDPEVRIFGDLAIVFGHYTFHLGEMLRHCGTNSFHLLRTADGWKIGNGASTLEFKCGE